MKDAGKYAVCFRALKTQRSGQSFCSSRCRLLSWAVKQLIKDVEAGKVDGLRGLIRELAGKVS